MFLWQLPAQAHREHEPQDEAVLPVVEVRSGNESAPALGLMDAASQGTAGANRIAVRPLARPADVLELVPGLIITQHSGQGKANQYFLRGFNLDHGTDFATTVNGVPVNMPTHAHGQGYSDLNFLIPELVERMDFRKGPYFVGQGDFASAGAANFHYRQQLDAPFADLSLGNHGYARALAADSGVGASGLRWLAAFEAMGDDGPWSNPDRLQKRNLHLGLAGGSAREGWSANAVAYRARWNSTDQVPQRLLDAGSWQGRPFSRWDTVDPSDGGETQRVSLAAEWHRIGHGIHDRVNVWWLDYGLDLWSNFTYAMNNASSGDQFSQRDRRQAMGLTASHQLHHVAGSWGDGFSTLGLYLRQDHIRVGLYNTVARQITATVRDDHVRQSLLGLYAENQWQWSPWLRSIVALELDRLDAQVQSFTLSDNSGIAQTAQLSPKVGMVLGPWHKTEFHVNAGRGFHSNDARGMTMQRDPANPAQAMSSAPGLVATEGMEAGLRSQPMPNFLTSLVLWRLNLDSELVYQGDSGTTAAGRASTRYGLEWSSQWQPARRWQLDLDLSWSHARYTEGPEARRFIPNAQEKVAQLTLSCKPDAQWLVAVQMRSLGSTPLTDDNSVRSASSVTTNLRVQHDLTGRATVTLDVFNLFDRRVNDIQYVYASQLAGESQPVTGLHVHPAEPLSVRIGLRVKF
jgi:hypothetical protein